MNHYHFSSCIAALCIAFIWFQIGAAQVGDANPHAFANNWQTVPMTEPQEPQNSLSQKDIENRGAYFDKIIGSKTPLDQPAQPNVVRAFAGDTMPQEEFPVDSSDTIVIANFSSYVPHLSVSKRKYLYRNKTQCRYGSGAGVFPSTGRSSYQPISSRGNDHLT